MRIFASELRKNCTEMNVWIQIMYENLIDAHAADLILEKVAYLTGISQEIVHIDY